MKPIALAIALAWPFAAHAAKLELEVGRTHAIAADANSWTARVGLDLFGHLTPSVRAIAETPGCCARQTWALLGELRAHTRGIVQLTAGLGLGMGTADVVRNNESTTVQLDRGSSIYAMGDLGVRLVLCEFWVGAGVGRSTSWDGYLATISMGWAPLRTRH